MWAEANLKDNRVGSRCAQLHPLVIPVFAGVTPYLLAVHGGEGRMNFLLKPLRRNDQWKEMAATISRLTDMQLLLRVSLALVRFGQATIEHAKRSPFALYEARTRQTGKERRLIAIAINKRMRPAIWPHDVVSGQAARGELFRTEPRRRING